MSRSTSRVVHGDAARISLARGAVTMVRLLGPTLGPGDGRVLVAREPRGAPESVLSAGVVARRVTDLDDRLENAGAMLVRHVAWRMHEEIGDGAATAAVMAGSMIELGIRAIAAGSSPQELIRSIDRACQMATDFLNEERRPIDDRRFISHLLLQTLDNEEIADLVAEAVVSVHQPYGQLTVERGPATSPSVDYVEGIEWNTGWLGAGFATENGTRITLVEPAILVTEDPISAPADLVAVLTACIGAGRRRLFIVAPEMSDAAIGYLQVNIQRGALEQATAVKAPSHGVARSRILGDLAALCGARCISATTGTSLAAVGARDLGSARVAWAERHRFAIAGGRGRRSDARRRLLEATNDLGGKQDDPWWQSITRQRLARLSGQFAVVRVGNGERARDVERMEAIRSAVARAQEASASGIVVGGGCALIRCGSRIGMAARAHGDEARGMQLVATATTRPLATIARNHGWEPAPLLHEAAVRSDNEAFDARTGCWVDAYDTGIVDPVSTLSRAIELACSAARSAISIDAVVLAANPEIAASP